MIDLSTLLLTAFYALFGILLMIVSNTIMDFFVPGDFAAEIKRGNCAVAWLSAGSFIGIGQILRAVILSPAYDAIPPDEMRILTRDATATRWWWAWWD